MSNFSAALRLTDLNDFIAPSQACVVTALGQRVGGGEGVGAAGEVQLRGAGGGGFEQTRQGREGEAVKVTLHDCLACSGCVTTAETVMLEQQSAHHMLHHLPPPGSHADSAGQTGQGGEGRKVVVVSLSPQSRAALAAHYKITPLQAFRKLTSFLHALGVAAVFDTSASRDVALIEACHDGLAAMPHALSDHRAATGATPLAPSDMVPAAGSAAATEAAAAAEAAAARESSAEAAQESGQSAPPNATPPPIPTDSLPHLPVLASACPGWVCYAEKAHGEYILPHMSRVKSAQQTMGALLKRFYASRLNTTPEQLYHVAVMPCYDKKLEAARDDFLLPGGAQASAQDGGENTRDAEGGEERLTEVDCVLTSGEIFALLQEQGVDFMALEEHPLDSMYATMPSHHAMPMPCPCHAHAMRMPCPCHAHAMPMPCPCHAHAMPMPCPCHAIPCHMPCHHASPAPPAPLVHPPVLQSIELLPLSTYVQNCCLSQPPRPPSLIPHDVSTHLWHPLAQSPSPSIPYPLHSSSTFPRRTTSSTLSHASRSSPPPRLTNVDASGHLYGVAGGSGGYAEAVLRYAALELFGVHVPLGPLEWQAVRNADMRECSVAVDGQPVLRVACAYGFRNIQNVLRRAKQGRCPYHYVEVMACPGGESGWVGSRGAGGGGESRLYQYHHTMWSSWLALAGRGGQGAGGLERPPEQRKAQPTRSYLQDLEAHYLAQVETRSPFANPLAQQIYSQFLGSPLSPSAQAVLHTSFHARPKTLALSAPTLAASW
ncbi:unnamed protein product [Closterium sp. NIES-65]|nr:unnamed protein product [Closterium sp. NIES-65]